MRDSKLQSLCRKYLTRLHSIAKRYGLDDFVSTTIRMNEQDKCRGTEEECEMLARLCNDERIGRFEIPKLLGKSYRQCESNGLFDKIRKLGHVGTYSKVSAQLLKEEDSDAKE